MLRPFVAFTALCLAVLVLAPTIRSVHDGVEALNVQRELPWQLWKWNVKFDNPDIAPPQCDDRSLQTYSEVTEWPRRIEKNESFTLGGIVNLPEAGGQGVPNARVFLYLNETKHLPGVFLGETVTDGAGDFTLTTRIPFALHAERYHLVAHVPEFRIVCDKYLEHWSDPELEVTSGTRFILQVPDRVVTGREVRLGGQLVDSVGAGVPEMSFTFTAGAERRRITTDAGGHFTYDITPERAGNISIAADFAGSKYYGRATATDAMEVVEEDVHIDGATGPAGFEVLRGQQAIITGTVTLPPGRNVGDLMLTFEGIRVRTCATCANTTQVAVTPDANGSFSAPFMVDPDQTPGEFAIRVTGASLRQNWSVPATLFVPVDITLDARHAAFFGSGLEGTATIRDDAGRAMSGAVAFASAGQWSDVASDANGVAAFSMDAPCGTHRVQALYNGTAYYRPTIAQDDVRVCPYMAFIPPFLLAIPWWVWPIVGIVGFVAWELARRLRERYAMTISRGPPVELAFTEPVDEAAGIVGVGEAASVEARLGAQLAEGLRFRIGTFRRMEFLEPDATHRVPLTLIPENLGDTPIRAEIIDKRGRVITRRTIDLHVVRYGEEIERRHIGFRREHMGAEADAVTPREFEAWLSARSDHMDPNVARRLVALFEEADYGPRDVGRAELLAYLRAERAVPEVTQTAVV